MKNYAWISIRVTVAFTLLLCGGYTMLVLGIARLAEPISQPIHLRNDNQVVAFRMIAQNYRSDAFFQARPSAVQYNAAGSGGSNLSPTSQELFLQQKLRSDSLMKHNPDWTESMIPAEMLSTSGSGLDPHLSRQAAEAQIVRIARARGCDPSLVRQCMESAVEKGPGFLFGPECVNVNCANVLLDSLLSSSSKGKPQ